MYAFFSDGCLSVNSYKVNYIIVFFWWQVEDDADLIEDGSPVLRSNRRLVLTTQLMQQISILSADACLEYDCATYAVSRVALGDACGAVSRSSDVGLAHEGTDL